jgi:hypothetical protein
MVDKNREFNKLIPEYLESDFSTSLLKNVELLKKSDTFKDYNYHGANMTMILELMSYLTDFNSFHTNMVAKNVYMESANVYETVHALALLKGYYPKGYISAYASIDCTLNCHRKDQQGNILETYISDGDQLLIRAWQSLDIGKVSINDEAITYNTTDEYIINVSNSDNPIVNEQVSFDFFMKEGIFEELRYTHKDIIDNEIILPFHNYDHGTYPFTVPSISVHVNDEEWIRVHDFYDEMSGLKEEYDDVYMFVYDKYKRYAVRFDTSRMVPGRTDIVTVRLLKSKGPNGAVGKNMIDLPTSLQSFEIFNITKNIAIPSEQIVTFTNNDSSILGTLPENVEDIKVSSKVNIHSQYRNVTSKDYRYHLEARTDVAKGSAWGEQEIDPGNVLEYNKVYVSVVPPEGINSLFIPGTIDTEVVTWTEIDDPSLSQDIEVPLAYNTDFRDDLLIYLEPRKMLNAYEVPVLPKIVYFRFDIGIRMKRTYNYSDVREDVKNKLIFFFDRVLRNFNEEISFMDIHNFILDQTVVKDDDTFENIKGVDSLVLRELKTYTNTLGTGNEEIVYEPNNNNLFPMYTYESFDSYIDNKLRTIKIGYDQYPMLAIDMCRFYTEL